MPSPPRFGTRDDLLYSNDERCHVTFSYAEMVPMTHVRLGSEGFVFCQGR